MNGWMIVIRDQGKGMGDMRYLVDLFTEEMICGKWHGKSKREAVKQADHYSKIYQVPIENRI